MSRVDVIVPCYNYGRFLRQCVGSVLGQSHADVRVLIIDDASRDDTPGICAELASEDPRIQVIRHAANIGHIATYNEGIEWARGDYLIELSADDFLLPGALARAVAVLDSDPDVGLAPGAYHIQRPDGPPWSVSSDRGALVRYDTWSAIKRLAWGNFVGTATAVVRTSLQKSLGGYLPELPHAGDLEMWLRFALAGPITYIHTLQAVYRRHESNMSEGYDRKADFDQCAAAFRLHLDAIRGLEDYGPSLAIRVDEMFAEKAASVDRETGTPHAPFSFFPIRPPPPVGVILTAGSGTQPLVAAVRQALPLAEILVAEDGVEAAVLAAGSPFDHFLALGGGARPTARQILALTRRLEAEPDRAHGLCGARLELVDGAAMVRGPMVQFDGPVSVLTGVIAFSKQQAVAAQRLRRRLGARGSASDDDILISCASTRAPICYGLGPLAGAPQAVAPMARDAPLRPPGPLLDRLLDLRSVHTFKPMTTRRGPWGSPRRSRSDQP